MVFPIAWGFFWSGHLVSIIMRLPFEFLGCLYPIYNYLMIKSFTLDEKYLGFQIWKEFDET